MPVQEYTVKLFRDSLDTPWGFRLQGGADFHTSLSIQRVFTGSPAEGELQRGDIILAIDNSDASCMSHALAEDLIRSSGGDLVLRIRRASPASSLPNTVYQTEQPAKMSWRTTSDHSASQSYGTDFASQARMQQYYYPSNNNYSAPSGVQSSGWAPVQPNPVQYDHQQPNSKFYQPLSFNKPAPTATYIQKPTRNPYSSTASAAHLQYNSPLGLYSAKNAQSALNMMVPNDSAAGQTIKLTSHQGGESRNDIVDSPTLRTVLLEDKVKATTGHAPNVTFYKKQHEYGPGKVPLRAYVEDVQDNVGISDF